MAEFLSITLEYALNYSECGRGDGGGGSEKKAWKRANSMSSAFCRALGRYVLGGVTSRKFRLLRLSWLLHPVLIHSQYTATSVKTVWRVDHTNRRCKETPKHAVSKLTGRSSVGFSMCFRTKPYPAMSVCGFWVPSHRLFRSAWCEPGFSELRFFLSMCAAPRSSMGHGGGRKSLWVCVYEYQGWTSWISE